jgi:mRNA interferase MazF
VLLDVGEANLPKQSVVNISQVFTVDKSQLGEKIGLLSTRRVRQILDGVQLLLDPIELNDWES